jgi:hypothetical protein
MPSIYAAKQIASALVKIGGVGFCSHNIASTLGKVLTFELEQDMASPTIVMVIAIQRQFIIFTFITRKAGLFLLLLTKNPASTGTF